MRILMILIPESDAPGSKSDPAVRLEGAAGPYYAFRDADVEGVWASSDGGSALMEVVSTSELRTIRPPTTSARAA
jgi:hypothetical protein